MVKEITAEDHEFIAKWVKEEKDRRANSSERKKKEAIWREVDRQVSMVPAEDSSKASWQANIEPGMLADALETFSDDILRIALPSDRRWFSPKTEIPVSFEKAIDNEGPESKRQQQLRSGALACLMSQQHIDTGFRENVKLSIKEAYKHGSAPVEVRFLEFPKWYDGGKKESLGAAVWVPHSMWDCYPAPTGTVQASSLSYQGSMIIR